MFPSWQLRYRCHGKPKRHQWWPWSGSFSWAPLAAGQNLKDIFKKNVSPDTVFYETWWNLKHIMIYYFILNWWSSEWHKCKLHLRMLRLRDSGDFMEISGADFDGLPCILRPCLFIFIYIYTYICWTMSYWHLPHASHLLFCCFNIGPCQKVFNLALSDGHPHVKEGSLCLTFGAEFGGTSPQWCLLEFVLLHWQHTGLSMSLIWRLVDFSWMMHLAYSLFFAWWGRVAETASLQIVKVDCRIESGCYVLKIQTPQGRQQKNCCELNHSIS